MILISILFSFVMLFLAPSSLLPPSVVYNELGLATIKIPFPQNPNGIADRLLNEMFVYASYPGSHGSTAIITMAEVKAFGSEFTMDLAVSTKYEFSINMWSPEGSSEIPRLSLVTPESKTDDICDVVLTNKAYSRLF